MIYELYSNWSLEIQEAVHTKILSAKHTIRTDDIRRKSVVKSTLSEPNLAKSSIKSLSKPHVKPQDLILSLMTGLQKMLIHPGLAWDMPSTSTQERQLKSINSNVIFLLEIVKRKPKQASKISAFVLRSPAFWTTAINRNLTITYQSSKIYHINIKRDQHL